MNVAKLDEMSWAMAEVYEAVTNRILINLARRFPYVQKSDELRGSFDYQARMLAQMGQVTRETVDIIAGSLDGADQALRQTLEEAIKEALKDEEPKLRKAAEQGILTGTAAEIAPEQMQAFQLYYRQSADKLNLVNTVMLESTEAAYRATVADAASRLSSVQSFLNVGAGEVVTGVSAWNKAMHDAVQNMVSVGITGFVDHGGHKWTPEAYVAMDIRTTTFNVARGATWELNEQYGNDLYQVSSHNGARPLCYPWQRKVISSTDNAREVEDLDGDKIQVIAQSATSYGQAAGLFGVNCRHYPMTFIPGFSTLKGNPQDEEYNERVYQESQEQRKLERDLRQERAKMEVLKAQGATKEDIAKQKERVDAASDKIQAFCDKTGRARRYNREYTPVNATWPDKETWGNVGARRGAATAPQTGGGAAALAGASNAFTVVPPEKIEYGELFDGRAAQVTMDVHKRITTLYRIDEPLGFVGDVRVSRGIPLDVDVFDVHDEYGVVPAKAQFIPRGNSIHPQKKAIIEVHDESTGSDLSMVEWFREMAEVKARSEGHLYTAGGGLEATLVHEYGHFVADYYGIFKEHQTDAESLRRAREFREWMVGYWRDNLEDVKDISLYAASAPDEMFAEAFLQSFDTEHKDTKAYRIADTIMRKFHQYIGFDPGR